MLTGRLTFFKGRPGLSAVNTCVSPPKERRYQHTRSFGSPSRRIDSLGRLVRSGPVGRRRPAQIRLSSVSSLRPFFAPSAASREPNHFALQSALVPRCPGPTIPPPAFDVVCSDRDLSRTAFLCNRNTSLAVLAGAVLRRPKLDRDLRESPRNGNPRPSWSWPSPDLDLEASRRGPAPARLPHPRRTSGSTSTSTSSGRPRRANTARGCEAPAAAGLVRLELERVATSSPDGVGSIQHDDAVDGRRAPQAPPAATLSERRWRD